MSMDDEPTRHGGTAQPRWVASSGYALGRMWHAIETASTHDDPGVRRRAADKAIAWEGVLAGMAAGTLTVGSRTPVADTPAWVTLQVVTGGFATGGYAAATPLDDDEHRWLAALPPPPSPDITPRQQLNLWFLSDPGLDLLTAWMRSDAYEVAVPEHAALPIVAWLLDRGQAAAALDLVAELHPFMDRLRFYPVPTAPDPDAATEAEAEAEAEQADDDDPLRRPVRLWTAGAVADRLAAVTVPDQVAAMRETFEVWHPLYDRLVTLWLDTVDDGWPARRWPDDWAERRQAWLDDHATTEARHHRSGEHRKTRSTLAILRTALERCPTDSSALTGRDVGRIRAALDRSVARWGAPGSPQHAATRAAQRAQLDHPTHQQLAGVVFERVGTLRRDTGMPSAALDTVLAPVTPVLAPEGRPIGRPSGAGTGCDDDRNRAVELPAALRRKVVRGLEAPLDELVDRGVVGSPEVIARMLPQVSAHVAASDLPDPALRRLDTKLYAAFRRRRSLLLLNLEHQVRLDELPWARAIAPSRRPSRVTASHARDALADTVRLTLTRFPQAIVPNPLVDELRALAQQAGLAIPFLEELAADIFMGAFRPKWRAAALTASTMLDGSLYARYYDLPPPDLWSTLASPNPDPPKQLDGRPGPTVDKGFARLCRDRAREAQAGDGSLVAQNGAVIEQSQIVTTHNLAPLTDALGLRDDLAAAADDVVARVFAWMIRQQSSRHLTTHDQMLTIKRTAYALRQAVFFLSLVDEAAQRAAVARLRELADGRGALAWTDRFAPVVDGLDAVVAGERFDARGQMPSGGRRLLGWSVGPHWLLPPNH